MTKYIRILNAFFIKHFYIEFSYKLNFFIQFLSIPIGIFSFYFFSKIVDSSSIFFENELGFLPFAIMGVASLDLSSSILNYISRCVREEQISGILEEISLLKISYILYFSFNSIYPFCLSLIRILVYLSCLAVLGTIHLHFYEIFLIITIAFITTIAMNGIALLTSASIIYFRRGNFITSIYITICGLIGGIVYPTSVLPRELEIFSYYLPTFHLASGLRSLLIDNSNYEVYNQSIFSLVILALIFNIIGIIVLKYVLYIVKSKSSLSNF